MSKHARRPPALQRQAFPALTAFVRGYLHQDLPVVHQTAAAAAAAFCADASPGERSALAQELAALTALTADRPPRDLQRFLEEQLGSAWTLRSAADLDELTQVVQART
jgi:hypothetical protein